MAASLGAEEDNVADQNEATFDRDIQRNKSFKHPLLIDAKRQIRLLEISDTASSSTTIRCTLRCIEVSELPNINYAALSYSWGEARTDDDIYQICVDDQKFWVRTSIWTFFQSLRSFKLATPIYIDVICLNQLDYNERNDQVKLMAQVYRHANMVHIWLGAAIQQYQSHLDVLRRQLSEKISSDAWPSEAFVGLSYICSSNYWRRLWIVQELLLSKALTLHCGDYAFVWDEVANFVKAPLPAKFHEEPHGATWWDVWEFSKPPAYEQEQALEDRLVGRWQSALRLFHYRTEWMSRTSRSVLPEGDGLPFHRAAFAFQYQQCRDKRDRVFALVGLLDTEGRQMINPDYTSTIQDVYIQAAAAGLISLWREHAGTQEPSSLRFENRTYCDTLNRILGVPTGDIEERASQALQIAVAYARAKSDFFHSSNPNGGFNFDSELSYGIEENAMPDVRPVGQGSRPVLLESPLLRSFDKFKESLSNAEKQDFPGISRKDLNITIAAIQNKQRATGTLQNMPRLRAFLDTTGAYSNLVETCLDERDVVNFVWGPVSHLLQITVNRADAFDGILSLYERLGLSIPTLAQTQSLPEGDNQSEVVNIIFSNVFEFHKLALRYFKNPAWQQLFASEWNMLKSKLGERIIDVQAAKELVIKQSDAVELDETRQARRDTSQRFLELLEQAKQARQEARDRFDKLDADEVERRRSTVYNWLCAPDAESDQDHLRSHSEGRPSSGHWLLKNARFRAWFDPLSVSAPLLWVTGRPGAGKSVLASLVVEKACELLETTTLYFYCRHDDPDKISFLSMAKSILGQLLLQKDALVMTYLFDIATKRGEATLKTIKLAKEALTTCLKAVGKTYIIIDGLDECQPIEQQGHVAKFWMNYVESSSSHPEPSRCVLFSRDDDTTRPLFSKLPTIRVEGKDHNQDISAYCSKAIEPFSERFELDDHKKAWIARITTERARGMFLYAHLVMNNLDAQLTRAELDNELEHNVFPDGIEKAYARIIDRILVRAPLPSQHHARRLLALVACATRLLRWREIQAATSIDLERQIVDFQRRQLTVGLKKICGALVDELPNGDITFAHSTVKQYLINHGHVDVEAGHASLTALCLDYFSLPCLSRSADDDAMRSAIATGQYALLDYAAISWTTHLEAPLGASAGGSFPQTLSRKLRDFYNMHWREPRKRSKPTKRIVELTDHISNLSIYDRTKDSMSSVHCLMSTNLADTQAVQTSDIFTTLVRIRSLTEGMAANSDDAAVLKHFYGEHLFKCPRVYCKWFHEGFLTLQERKSHIDKHERSHYCTSPGCIYTTLGFPTAKELNKHVAEVHQTGPTDNDFPDIVEDVDTPEAEEAPVVTAEVPVPATESNAPESSSAATNRAQPAVTKSVPEQQLKPPEPVKRRRKGPTTFQCEICPKKFTRAFGLKSHMRTHIDDRQYACATCGRKFNRQRDCKRHEDLHNGQKKHACYGPLKRGGHWGCNRRFARADALGRHFRSEGGRACIQPLWDEQEAEKQRERIEIQRRLPIPSRSHTWLRPGAASATSGPSGYNTPMTLPGISNFNYPDALLQQYPSLIHGDSVSGSQSITPDPSFGQSSGGAYDESIPDSQEYDDVEMDYGQASEPRTHTPGGSFNAPYYVD